MGFFITEPNTGDYLIQLKSKRTRTTGEVIDDIRKQVESTQPALRIDFGQVIGDMLGDLMASIQPVEIKIFGNDQKKLQELSRQTSAIIADIPGIANWQPLYQTAQVWYNRVQYLRKDRHLRYHQIHRLFLLCY